MELTETFMNVCTSLPTKEKAQAMATMLIREKLAFCCWIRPSHTAIYEWKNTIHNETEVELLCKTLPGTLTSLVECIQAEHPYSAPYIGVFEGVLTQQEYVDWAKEQSMDV